MTDRDVKSGASDEAQRSDDVDTSLSDRYSGNFTLIMGESVATAARMAAYALSVNPGPKLPSCTVKQLAEMFLEEGRVEGVRGDAAWAQSLLETGYFKYGRIVAPDMNNYSGIGALYEDRPGFAARFDSPRLGVRAQIQHLKAYATDDPLNGECIDPRFEFVVRGSAPYIEWLGAADNPKGRGWAFPGGGYGKNILRLLERMLAGR
jgi:hypothetical protein